MTHIKRLITTLTVLSFIISGCAPTGRNKSGALKPFAKSGVTRKALKGKRYALVVGINQFEDKHFGTLQYATNDAQAIASALSGFDKVLLLNTPKTTSRAAILQKLKTLNALVKSKHDTVVIYFSTHGTLGRKPGKALQRYLVTTDTRISIVGQTGLSVREIMRAMNRLRSTRKALILATCHSGQGKSKLSDALVKALAKNKGALAKLDEVSEASFVFSASAFKEVAREEDRLKHDVYTYFFLQGIQKGDRDNDGAVTISEAHDYARVRTYQFTRGTQRPTATSSILGRDPIILKGSITRRPKPVIYSYRASSQGIAIQLAGRTKGVLPGGVVVPPGKHNITLIDTQTKEVLHQGTITLNDGDRLEITALIQPKPHLDLGIGVGAIAPISSAIRAKLIPLAPTLQANVSLARWPWTWSWLNISYSNARASGQTDAFGQTLPYEYTHHAAALHAGGIIDLNDHLDINMGLGFGALWANRRFDTPQYQDQEALRGSTLSTQLSLNWHTLSPWIIGVRSELGILRASLGQNIGPHPFGAISVWSGVRF